MMTIEMTKKLVLFALLFPIVSGAHAKIENKNTYVWKPASCGPERDSRTNVPIHCQCEEIGFFKIAYDKASGYCTIQQGVEPASACQYSSKTFKIDPDMSLFIKQIEVTPTKISYLDVSQRMIEASYDWKAHRWNVYFADNHAPIDLDQSADVASIYGNRNVDNAHTQILLYTRPKPRFVLQKRPNRMEDPLEETEGARLVVTPFPTTGQTVTLWYLDYPVPLAKATIGQLGTPGHQAVKVKWNQNEPDGYFQEVGKCSLGRSAP